MQEPLLRVREMARRLAISVPQAYRLLHSGEIPPVRVGQRSIRVRERDLERYIRRGPKTAA